MPINEKNHSEHRANVNIRRTPKILDFRGARKAFRGITPENIVRHELIGLEAEIVKSTDARKIGVKGKIIDETKKMLLFRTENHVDKIGKLSSKAGDGEKWVEKAICVFRIILPGGKKVDVNGMLFSGRPEERIKKKLPQKWDAI